MWQVNKAKLPDHQILKQKTHVCDIYTSNANNIHLTIYLWEEWIMGFLNKKGRALRVLWLQESAPLWNNHKELVYKLLYIHKQFFRFLYCFL